ncbi:Proline-, glutamic acid- and leucine-rich protein 1 [Habropoda laboriosa]|uniref:Proline-, glutamic acid-and leucine-rich protein 1 n=1 Tax=Habropoda laboriosa TaxID=597456 RepID=A0A0L7QZE4_9HYME|nr:PREDICTED: proline-, glutamic acid- and leucine-rich protein 1-like [Habropoda laboriosa]KOC63926.1 Proline-, glutamic acid- and leucine-rich protein 1 [Habropoda laboriosa]
MATLVQLINSFDHDSKEYEEFLQTLICFNGDIPFNLEEVDCAQNIIISTINEYLNRSQSRHNGLLILDKILPQCSKDVLLKYCVLWMSKATQVLESIHSTLQELSISCKVLGYLLIRSKDISDIQKQVSMQNVKQLINIISNMSVEKICGSIYYLTAVLLHQYPEVCERYQIFIRKIILLQIDSPQENLVDASAKCYVLLAKATERSFKAPISKLNYISWTYNQALICNSIHAIMDELFSGFVELENVDIWDKLELPNISEKNVIQFYFTQERRFCNLCSYLSYMLCGIDKKNSVLPHEILKVICRGLAIQPLNLKNQNFVKEQMLYLILPKLHIALFNVLDALINGFKDQLIPFGSTILQLFLQTLQWTENVLENQTTISGNKPFKNVRISVYKCLNSWLVNTNALSGIETVADEFLPSILKDIVPEKDRVLLTIQKTHNLSKRALKRLRDSQYEKGTYLNNGIASNKEYYLDVDVCKVALNVLQNIHFSGGTLLKQVFFTTIQNIIIPLLYDCYFTSTEQKFYKENPDCCLLLLRVLRALQLNPHSLVPLPTQYSLEIFEIALNDKNIYIAQEAKVALAELEKIVHSHAPPIQITQVEIIEKEFVADGQSVQERMEATEDVSPVNVETAIDENTEPLPNKRLKVIHSNCNKIDELTTKNITENESCIKQTNQDVLKIQDNTLKQQVDVIVQNNNIVESEQVTEICDKSSNESSSASVAINVSETPESTSQYQNQSISTSEVNEGTPVESMDTTQVADNNFEIVSKVPEENQICLSSEKEKKEEEILQLFQDIPKDNN